jgi:hypothetical protein
MDKMNSKDANSPTDTNDLTDANNSTDANASTDVPMSDTITAVYPSPGLWEKFVNEIKSLNEHPWIIVSIILGVLVLVMVLCIVIAKCRKKR